MDLLVALIIVILAWVLFKSLLAVLIVLAICALVVYLVHNRGGTRL